MSVDAAEMKRYEKFIKRWPKGHLVKYQGRVYTIEHSGRTNHSSAHYLEDFLFLRWVKSNHEFCFQCSKSDYICCEVLIGDIPGDFEEELERMDDSGFLPKSFQQKGLHTHEELHERLAYLQGQIKDLEDLAKTEGISQ